MPAPTSSDGVTRAFSELAVPPIGVLLAVVFTEAFLGELVAGILYLGLVLMVILGISMAAVHWNTKYMISFVTAGFVLLFIIPDIVSTLLDPIYGFLGTALWLIGLLLVAVLLADRIGLNELFTDW